MAYLPGNEGGPALADILTGKVNPSGKLPFTYPRFANSLLTYDHKYTDQIARNFSTEAFDPQWEFGEGLSYTRFDYSKLSIAINETAYVEEYIVKVNVKNTGKRAGQEVVQVYVSDLVASITPSVKRLRAFEKVSLEPGEERQLEIKVSVEELAFVGKDNRWVTEPGRFKVEVGDQQVEFSYRE